MSTNMVCRVANYVGVGNFLGCTKPLDKQDPAGVAAELINKMESGQEGFSEANIVKLANSGSRGGTFLNTYAGERGIWVQHLQVNGWLKYEESGYPRLLSLLLDYLDRTQSPEDRLEAKLDPTQLIWINAVLTEYGSKPIKPGESISDVDLKLAITAVNEAQDLHPIFWRNVNPNLTCQ